MCHLKQHSSLFFINDGSKTLVSCSSTSCYVHFHVSKKIHFKMPNLKYPKMFLLFSLKGENLCLSKSKMCNDNSFMYSILLGHRSATEWLVSKASKKLYIAELQESCMCHWDNVAGFFLMRVDFQQVWLPWGKNSTGDRFLWRFPKERSVGMCLNSILHTYCSLTHSFLMASHFRPETL